MKAETRTTLWQFIICLLPAVILWCVWNELADRLPMHYTASGEIDRFGSRTELAVMLHVVCLIGFGAAQLVRNSYKLDARYEGRDPGNTLARISWVVLSFITLIAFLIVYSSLSFSKKGTPGISFKFIELLICLLFVVLAGFMGSVKQNYFVGFRTGTTLSSEENWRRTHHFGARMMFITGLVMGILILALPENVSAIILISGVVVMATATCIYSYRISKKEEQQ